MTPSIRDNKVKLHKDLNEAFAIILSIALKVDIGENGYKRIKDKRTFLSSLIDDSNHSPS